MKIAVYAISKNEEKFVERWVDSMCEADEIVVLDTGSEDNTVDKLRERNVKVSKEKISPWRFDVARNRSLELVSYDTDICVCTDLDEVFQKGWRSSLEKQWKEGTTQARYRYTWSFNPDGSEGIVFWAEKIHSRNGYKWTHPVHEILERTDKGGSSNVITLKGVQLDHHPDETKSRGQYLKLLELSVLEDPDDDRNMHYLGREYLYKGMWDKCIETLKIHLCMPTATWADERAASMRYIAKAYLMKKNIEKAKLWYMQAIVQAPHLREPYVDLARLLFSQNDWEGVIYFINQALRIKERPQTYISDSDSWGSLSYDLLSISFYKTNRIFEAFRAAKIAEKMSPFDERIKNNVKIIGDTIEKQAKNVI